MCVLRRKTRGIAPLTSVYDLTSVDQLAALLPVGQLSKKELEAIQRSMRLQLLLFTVVSRGTGLLLLSLHLPAGQEVSKKLEAIQTSKPVGVNAAS